MCSVCYHVPPRSYDSAKEDAQNPFPEPDDSPRGKTAYQAKGKKTKCLGEASVESFVETPPPRRRSFSEGGSMTKKVKNALRRPQTVDELTSTERKQQAQTMQRKLEKEFEDARENKKKRKDARPEPEESSSGKKPRKSPKEPGTPDTKDEASPQAKPKAKAKATEKAKASPSPQKSKAASKKVEKPKAAPKRKCEDEDEDDGYSMKDHATATSSSEPSPASKKMRVVGKTSAPRDEANLTGKDKDSKPAAPTEPAPSPNNEEGPGSDDEGATEKRKEAKKVAHRLYMRLYRNIQRHGPSSCEQGFHPHVRGIPE